MTIKSDTWIRNQCIDPGFKVELAGGGVEYAPAYPVNRQGMVGAHSISKKDDSFMPMISPFVGSNIREENGKRIISYGLSSYGYDVRLADKFKLFVPTEKIAIYPSDDDDCKHCITEKVIVDPLESDDYKRCLIDMSGDSVIIPPNSYLLGHTVEYFHIPNDVLVVCVGKSTLARCGLAINVTPIEPGFKGEVVIEISNMTSLPVRVHANQGIAQFLFFQSDEVCSTSYSSKSGKYQGQTGITLAKL